MKETQAIELMGGLSEAISDIREWSWVKGIAFTMMAFSPPVMMTLRGSGDISIHNSFWFTLIFELMGVCFLFIDWMREM